MSTDTPAVESELLQWRRVHPVTPLVRSWAVILGFVLIFGNQVMNAILGSEEVDAETITGGIPTGYFTLGIISIILIMAVFFWLSWRRMQFAVAQDAVHLRSGIIFRTQRQARLDRLQAVDTAQPLVARIFGLIELKIEVAGGGKDSGVHIGFLTQEDAAVVRNEILMNAAGLKTPQTAQLDPVSGSPVDSVQPVAPIQPVEAPERLVYIVPAGNLLYSIFMSWGMFILIAVSLIIFVTTTVLGQGEIGSFVFVFIFVFAVTAFTQFSQNYDFTAAISADGIRLRQGLLEKRSQTVPPGRIQAIELRQPLLWKFHKRWSLVVNVAGYGQSTDAKDQTRNVILPVGDIDEVLMASWLVMPDLGVESPGQFMKDLLTRRPQDLSELTMNDPRSKWIDPLTWRRNGFMMTQRAVIITRGRLTRRIYIIPHERTQSLGVRQGPILRLLRLATVGLHSVPGPVVPRMIHLDETVAAQFLDEQPQRASQARSLDATEQWMSHVNTG